MEKASGRAKQIIVSGGILKSPASLQVAADALGRDVCVSPEAEASLRGAAVYVLEQAWLQSSGVTKTEGRPPRPRSRKETSPSPLAAGGAGEIALRRLAVAFRRAFDLTGPAADREADRPATDAAILDQILLALRSIPPAMETNGETEIACPTAAIIPLLVDTSQREQYLIEDCSVCCRPISLTIRCRPGQSKARRKATANLRRAISPAHLAASGEGDVSLPRGAVVADDLRFGNAAAL